MVRGVAGLVALILSVTGCGRALQGRAIPESLFKFSAGQTAAFYRWDGSLAKAVSSSQLQPTLVTPDGRYYVDTSGHVVATLGWIIGTIADWAAPKSQWIAADDSHHFCGSSPGQIELVALDGKTVRFHIPSAGALASIWGCSVSTGRAIVSDGTAGGLLVVSTTTGAVLHRIYLPGPWNGMAFSMDAAYIAVSSGITGGPASGKVSVLDTAGKIVMERTSWHAAGFSADHRLLLAGDLGTSTTHLLDWETGKEIWNKPGIAQAPTVSDPTTNRMLIPLMIGSPMQGTAETSFWIVDGSGRATAFHPSGT